MIGRWQPMIGAIGVVAGWLTPVTAWGQERPYGWAWGMGMHPMWGAWGIAMMLMMLVFWGVVIAGLVLGIRWLASQGRESRGDAAMEILRQRYARGEINKEEFESRKRDLS